MGQQALSYLACGKAKKTTLEAILAIFYKTIFALPFGPTILLLGIYSENIAQKNKKMHMHEFFLLQHFLLLQNTRKKLKVHT